MSTDTDVLFDPLSEEYFTGAERAYKRLRDEAPVYRNDKHDFYALSRYDDVAAAYKDWQTYTSSKGIMLDQMSIPGFDGQSMPGFLGLYDPPQHLRMRTLTSSALTPSKIGLLEQAVRAAVDAALDRLADSASPNFMVDLASQFPAEVLYDLMGIPLADRDRVARLSTSFMLAGEEGEESLFNPERMQAMTELVEYYRNLSVAKRESSDDDVITRMVRARWVDADGVEQALSDLEVGGYLLQLIAAGVESSAKLMAATFVRLHRHGLWHRVVEDSSLIPAALHEAGRLEAPVQFLGRKTTREVTMHGTTIPAGANVLLLMAAANRDDRVYDDPDTFRIERAMPRQPLTFGMGPHACMGKHLAELEGRIALEEMGRRFPNVTVDEAGLERVRAIHVFGWRSVPVRLS